jgi:hypothetical protein
MSGIRVRVLVLLAATFPSSGSAQSLWISAWGGGLMNPGTVVDFESNTRWDFGTSFMGGAGVHTRVGPGLMVGVDLGYSPVRHEVVDRNQNVVLDEGRANILTLMLAGRLGAGRTSGMGTYLAGGIGTMVFGIPHLDRWDADLAMRGGGGVEYAQSSNLLFFLEWHRWWVFHQAEGVQDNVMHAGSLELGVRIRP